MLSRAGRSRWWVLALALLALDAAGQQPVERMVVPVAPRSLVADANNDAALVVVAHQAADPLATDATALGLGWAEFLLRKGVQPARLAVLGGPRATVGGVHAELDRLATLRPARLWLVVLARGATGPDGAWQVVLTPAAAGDMGHATAATDLVARARKAGPVVAIVDAPAPGAAKPMACAGECAVLAHAVRPPEDLGRLAWHALAGLVGHGDRNGDGQVTLGEAAQFARDAGLALAAVEPAAEADERADTVLARLPRAPAASARPPSPPPPSRPPASPPPPPPPSPSPPSPSPPSPSPPSPPPNGDSAKKAPPPPTGGGGLARDTKKDAVAPGGSKVGGERRKSDGDLGGAIGDGFGKGGLGLSGTGRGGGGSGEGSIGVGGLGTVGRGGGVGSGNGYGSGGGRGMARRRHAPIERFPTLEAPDRAEVGQIFGLQVSLTERKVVVDVKVQQGAATAEGKLQMELDDTPGPWTIDVAVAAPGFDVLGDTMAQLSLPKVGDSTPALFKLRARPALVGRAPDVFVTFWFKGRFLAKVSKPIAVGNAEVAAGPAPAQAPAAPTKPAAVQGVAANVAAADPVPDLTLWVLHGGDPSRPDEAQILVQSPHLQPSAGFERFPADLGQRLDAQYARFVQRISRGAETFGAEPAPAPAADRTEETRLLLRGFGKELYANATPLLFKQALATLIGQLGGQFRAIQIYTNNPRLPWELLVAPKPGGGETDFLGVDYRIARWHITPGTQVLHRPPPQLEVAGVYVVAPSYAAAAALPAQEAELKAIAGASSDRFRKLAGDFAAVKSLVAGKQPTTISLVHFAGHGQASAQADKASPEFTIRLADRELPLLAWKGLGGNWGGAHPLVFFNACEVGRAERTAGFVDGWGPAVLETGASGYIGGLWPLGDRAASDAAAAFYQSALSRDGALVAEAVRQVRARFAATGDPTYLAYVYYGDANLALRRAGAEESEPEALRVAVGNVDVSGGLSPDIVRRIAMRNLGQIRYCVEREATRGTNVGGMVVVQLAISPEGAVLAVTTPKSTMTATAAVQCITERFRRLVFPKPEGGGLAMATVTLAVR
ncbi:MAG: CHAT domain-containing protein [Deltaproteobacteria bacterium]|nr:CHAT domain-containing protein [Deltaproteobacteria bacterium]